MWVVFPPGAAQASSTRRPGLGSSSGAMRWAERSCTHQWPSLNPASSGKGPGRLVSVSPSGSPGSASAGSCSSKASRLLRRRLQRRSSGGMRLLAAAKASVRSGPIWAHNSATNQSGSECSKAKRCLGSLGTGKLSPASIARSAPRSTPFTTGAKRCSRSRLASSTAVLTAAETGTRSISRICCRPTCSSQRSRGGCLAAGTLPRRSSQASRRRRWRMAP